MSLNLTFATQIRSVEQLRKACEVFRTHGASVTEPRAERRTLESGRSVQGYAIRFDKEFQGWKPWSGDAFFACDETGEMVADNYSDYFDNRKLDKAGNRINGTGTVHEQVLLYEKTNGVQGKQVGADGRWGDIRFLNMFNVAATAAGYILAAEKVGDTVTYDWQNNHGMQLALEAAR